MSLTPTQLAGLKAAIIADPVAGPMRATSEVTVAAGLTVRAGSWLKVREMDN